MHLRLDLNANLSITVLPSEIGMTDGEVALLQTLQEPTAVATFHSAMLKSAQMLAEAAQPSSHGAH